MKKKERFFKKDSSNQSVTVLKDKVNAYLYRKFEIDDAWVCDYYLPHRESSYDKVLDVVFFGDFLRKFLQGSLWPFDQYRLWVISYASKSVMVNFLGIPSESIAVIPRYELFSKGGQNNIFDIKKVRKLYYVGQLRSEKNILISLWLVFFLQAELNQNIEFNIVGEFFLGDDYIDQERVDFKNKVLGLINELEWKVKPILHGRIENFSWEKRSNDTALLNLSTFFHEDFSVSQAYAQENNWYSIVSQWGGFLDIVDTSCIKIPFQMIGNSSDSILESKVRAQAIAKFLIRGGQKNVEKAPQNITLSLPCPIGDLDLHDIRKKFVQNWGPSLYHVFTNINLVLDSQKGFSFFENYQAQFSQNNKKIKKVLLINELDEKIFQLESRIIGLDIDEETSLIQIKNLRFKEILLKVLAAEEVYIPKELIKSELLLNLHGIINDNIREY